MPVGLLTYARKMLEAGPAGLSTLDVPLLVWESTPERPGDEPLLDTQAGTFLSRPRSGEPVVFELKKGNAKANAFAMGITVGRADSNDVPIDDVSISRFHAYFQKDAKSGVWKLYDAESMNGTWLGPLKLTGKGGEPLKDKARLRFGDIEVTFLEPPSFIAYLNEQLAK